MQDCIIVGGGPAGLTAALYLARYLRRVLLIDAGEGRARMIPATHNLAPFPDGISGTDLLHQMHRHARQYGAVIRSGNVTGVEKTGDLFHVAIGTKTETARSLILACGVVNHPPPLPASTHTSGVQRGLIRYCPVCDAYEVRGKRIAVLGSGDHGLQEALFLRHYSPAITLIPPEGQPDPQDGIATLAAPLKSLTLTDSEVIITLQNGDICPFDTLYVALGTTPRSALAAGMGLKIDTDGCVTVDAQHRSSLPGAYAIGDLTEGLDQITTAMGHGAVAATAIHNALP